jgi:Integrase zinc binding domain
MNDETLNHEFSLAWQGKVCYVINNGLLFQHVKYCGKDIVNLVVPQQRRNGVLKLAYNSAHWAAKKTKQRVILSGLVCPTLAASVSQYCASCSACQLRAHQLKSDKEPISIVEKAGQGQIFEHMHCDVFGPIMPGQNVRFS